MQPKIQSRDTKVRVALKIMAEVAVRIIKKSRPDCQQAGVETS